MKKTVVTSCFATMILAISTCVTYSQTCSPCGPAGFPSYQNFCQQNQCDGPNFFNDKMVRPFNHGLSACCDPCGSCCFGGGFGCGLFGRNVQCAGPDFGYVYKPGYGANGQGFAPRAALGFGAGAGSQQGYAPSYTYRSPRDFLNPNPPSIGY